LLKKDLSPEKLVLCSWQVQIFLLFQKSDFKKNFPYLSKGMMDTKTALYICDI